ncbi:MAG: sensor histidine kinase [Chloroflexota bacterium]
MTSSAPSGDTIDALQSRIHALELQLQDREERLQAAARELEDLAHFISHDLRAPLRGVDGYSQALLQDYDGCLDEVGQAYLGFIRDSSRLASILIDRMLIYARTMRRPVQLQTVDLGEAACRVLDRLQTTQPERRASVEIADGLLVEADPGLMEILLEELLGNAWKFTRLTPVTRISLQRGAPDGQPCFSVQDNGAGFNMQYVHKLFKPFERLHGAYEYEGAGLGLAIARRIVERHGGRIWAESILNQGTTITFTLLPQAAVAAP